MPTFRRCRWSAGHNSRNRIRLFFHGIYGEAHDAPPLGCSGSKDNRIVHDNRSLHARLGLGWHVVPCAYGVKNAPRKIGGHQCSGVWPHGSVVPFRGAATGSLHGQNPVYTRGIEIVPHKPRS